MKEFLELTTPKENKKEELDRIYRLYSRYLTMDQDREIFRQINLAAEAIQKEVI